MTFTASAVILGFVLTIPLLAHMLYRLVKELERRSERGGNFKPRAHGSASGWWSGTLAAIGSPSLVGNYAPPGTTIFGVVSEYIRRKCKAAPPQRSAVGERTGSESGEIGWSSTSPMGETGHSMTLATRSIDEHNVPTICAALLCWRSA
jgi:hypothetical protein